MTVDEALFEEALLRVIPTGVHAVFDYVVGALLVAAPWLFDFARGGVEMWILLVLGAGQVGYSLCTDYELAAARIVPMPIHLLLDVMIGVLLAVSPWLFGFAGYVWAPHVVVGLLCITLALTTWRTAAYTKSGAPADASSF